MTLFRLARVATEFTDLGIMIYFFAVGGSDFYEHFWPAPWLIINYLRR